MKHKLINGAYSSIQVILLVSLRILIGWHFLYEGMIKLLNSDWSSIGFLLDSQGPFSGLFLWMAANPKIVDVVDFLNVYGLIAIGAGLILGLFTQLATLSGVVLLGFYFLSHPPFIGYQYSLPAEGSYLWVNKNLIELFALLVLYVFPTGKIIGADRLYFMFKSAKK